MKAMRDDHVDWLPDGWMANLSPYDAQWISRSVFQAKGKLSNDLKTWWHPPSIPVSQTKPVPKQYFTRRLFLWAPSLMWRVDLHCPRCPSKSLTSKGVYNRVRMVLDVKDWYYLAAQYHECSECRGTYIAYDARLLSQLPDGIRCRFPIVLTHKYACDLSVVALLRARTLGNSTSALQNNLQVLQCIIIIWK